MKVLDKMNELVGENVTKEQIIDWAYMNRIMVMSLPDEDEFKCLEKIVERFIKEYDYHSKADEFEAWDKFLDYETEELNK